MNQTLTPQSFATQASLAPRLSLPSGPALCPLIMAGDPNLDTTRHLLARCVAEGVAMVELCLPFRNAFTDGATLQHAHARALQQEASLQAVLQLVAEFSSRIKIILLADSSHTLRPLGIEQVLQQAAAAGVAGVLPHGLPPRLGESFQEAARQPGLPVVGTIYANATPETRRQVLGQTTAFLYLVSTYGRSGGAVEPSDLKCQIDALRAHTPCPIALGFGLRSPGDVGRAFDAGSDIAIVGSAVAGQVEAALKTGGCPIASAGDFIAALQKEAHDRRPA